MTDFADGVGIRFREVMSGFVAEGEVDPAKGERLGRETGQDFSFDLGIEIPSLNQFLKSPIHEAGLSGGTVKWRRHFGEARVLRGAVALYRDDENELRETYLSFPRIVHA